VEIIQKKFINNSRKRSLESQNDDRTDITIYNPAGKKGEIIREVLITSNKLTISMELE
jgi:hypothetical protein